MRDELVDKHYKISKNIIENLEKKTIGRFSTQTKAVEYFLKLGFEYEDSKVEKEKILLNLNQCLSEVRFIKKQVEQIFANFNWDDIKDPKNCVGYQKFLNKFRKVSNFDD